MDDAAVKVYIIDDDRDVYKLVKVLLESVTGRKYTIDWGSSYAEGLSAITEDKHDIYILDYFLGNRNGLDLLREAISGGCRKPIIFCTGAGDYEVDKQAMDAGAADYIDKSQLDGVMLERVIRYALERRKTGIKLEEMVFLIERSRDDLLSILDQLRQGTIMIDENGHIVFLNNTGQKLLGKNRKDVTGKHWRVLFDRDSEIMDRLRDLITQPDHDRQKVTIRHRVDSGSDCWMEVDILDDPRDQRRHIFYLYDVTDMHNLRSLMNERTQFHDLIGKSELMLEVYEKIRDVSAVDSTVLIEGETGTGKELVARAIHYSGHRKAKPFVAINCAGLTESLLGSQLFGHRKGAFTGAVNDQEGIFEAANGGTIFLDEIGDIPMSVQINLLRVLQEQEITRLGESKPRKINVRVLAATQDDLNREVEQGHFRSDLLYRIRVARIHLPPLRERREDIPLLAASFLGQYGTALAKKVEQISDDAMGALLRYHWPGNVRELKSAVEYAVIHCKTGIIAPVNLPPEVSQQTQGPVQDIRSAKSEKDRIVEALDRTDGNRVNAARLLGLSRATLYRRLEKYGITAGKGKNPE